MGKRLIVLSSEYISLSFLLEGFELYKLEVDKRKKQRLVGSLFKGKVKRIVKGMGGVFVDIGIGKEAYLPIKKEEYPRVGESVIVQVVREPTEEKGAKVTNKPVLVGKALVYMPLCEGIKCSSKLDQAEKSKLIEMLNPLVHDKEGFIVRTSAQFCEYEDIKKDLESLRSTWNYVLNRSKIMKKPGLILEEFPKYITIIRDYWYQIEEIIVDNPVVWNEIVSFLESFHPELLKKVVYTKDSHIIINRYDLNHALRKIFNRRVWLKSGGFIVIDKTEALTVIDVNSGDPSGNTCDENALKTNLEAAHEIAKQIVLRNIAGIIIVDFIDMQKQEHKEEVIKALQTALKEESCHVQIYGFTKLGMLEMVRKKTDENICWILSEECPVCKGRGRVKSDELLTFEIEKDVAKITKPAELYVRPEYVPTVENLLKKLGLESKIEVIGSEEMEYGSYEIHYKA
ncbi:Rne/Rng family ribonuclease [Thermocrinis minervae]|uniref:Ribonuclease G n=1 Tax=Thermocrinis minervae TaxID=381751 RepID=A0A1M6RAR9_9AQUI|nr:Rne/Rng family ribonuclease [Thermocrinis minervae]SHK29559.1 ribonuclease G [Thermocrinis minervae]